ncbi:MAG: insulinase family protein [Blastocatellia bacterium]|nr:insulinase family protein [Blastocatellia bacterium]
MNSQFSILNSQFSPTTSLNPVRTVLPNGLTVISEPMPHLRSITLSIWLRAGSRHEPPQLNGVTHFIEHLLFKGTKRRTAQQIAIESDNLGGQVDAFTSRECTGFHIQTLDSRLAEGFDLLADLLLSPKFAADDFERERKVILEEMKMIEDSPEELVFEKFIGNFWPGHPLGFPIEGTEETVGSFSLKAVKTYYKSILKPQNLVISAAGNLEHGKLLELAERFFGGLKPSAQELTETAPATNRFLDNISKSGEQTHVVLGLPCPALLDEERPASNVLATLLGGGLSSRLFLKIREEEGLAYNIYSDIYGFRDVGCLLIYAATSPENLKRTVSLICAEIKKLAAQPIPVEEIERAKNQMLANFVLGLESSAARAGHLGRQEILYRELYSLDELTREIAAVTTDEVQRLVQSMFSHGALSCTALGPLGRRKITQDLISL